MTLTVPQSNRAAGRAPRLVEVEAGGVGQAAADLGQRVQALGNRIVQQDLTHERQRVQVDYTRALGEARQTLEQEVDPAAIDAAWPARAAEIRETALAGVDPRNRETLGIAFDELANRHALALGQRSIGLRQARQEADYIEYSATIVGEASRSDPETREALISDGIGQIDELEAAGTIGAEEAARRRVALVRDVDEATAIRLAEEDPEAFLAAREAGGFDILGKTADTLATRARTTLERERAAAATAAERAIGDELAEMRGIFAAGQVYAGEAEVLARAEVQAHPDFAETVAAQQLRDAHPELERMTPGDLTELVEIERQTPLVKKYQTERLKLLEKTRDRLEKAWDTDPIATSRETLSADLGEMPEAGAGGQDWVSFITRRAAAADKLVESGYAREPRMLDREEAAALNEMLAVETDPATRAEIAGALTAALGSRRDLLGQVLEDPTLAHVGGLMVATGNAPLARDILRGQQVLEAGTAILPPEKDRTGYAFEELETVFAFMEGGEARQAAVVAAADALYARRKRIDGPVDAIDEDDYRQAIHEVLGGTGRYNGREVKGGVQEVRGLPTILPSGIGAREVDDWFERIGRVDVTGPRGIFAPRRQDDDALLDTHLARISQSEKPPRIGGKAITGETRGRTLDRFQIVRKDPDSFAFEYAGTEVYDADGQPYRFSMNALRRIME